VAGRLAGQAVEVDEHREPRAVPEEEHRVRLVLDAVRARDVVFLDQRAEQRLDLVVARRRLHAADRAAPRVTRGRPTVTTVRRNDVELRDR
jgi:hypothetical protein